MNNETNQTIKIENSLMKFSDGIFKDKKIRITNNYVSVFDIIQVAGGQKNPKEAWKNLIKKYETEVVQFLYYFKFPGAGQRETPCINVEGLVKLLMWIPGKKAIEFRNLTANVMIRYLGGDKTLTNEINNFDKLHIENGNNDIFRNYVQKKIKYDRGCYFYVRIFNKFFEDQQKNFKCDNTRLSFDIIKFGIADEIQNRENSYGNDYGYFQYAIKLPSKEMAINIEKVFRKEYKELTVGNSYEYLHSKKLAKYFKIIKNRLTS